MVVVNSTIIRALYNTKLLWSALNVAGSQVVVKRPIKAPLLGEGGVGFDLDTVKILHSVWVNRWDLYLYFYKVF